MALCAPSLLAADFLNLGAAVDLVNKKADIIHLDIMDGIFVPNISFGFPVVKAVASVAEKPMDVHLMITRPEKYIPGFADVGASMISFHEEAVEKYGGDVGALLRLIRSKGAKAGLVINPDIPVEKLYPHLDSADYVLLMSVFAGFGGQKFIDGTLDRIREVKGEILRRGLDVKIEVDGGINASNAPAIVEAGADILVMGSAVFKAADPESVIAAVRGRN